MTKVSENSPISLYIYNPEAFSIDAFHGFAQKRFSKFSESLDLFWIAFQMFKVFWKICQLKFVILLKTFCPVISKFFRCFLNVSKIPCSVPRSALSIWQYTDRHSCYARHYWRGLAFDDNSAKFELRVIVDVTEFEN